MTTNDIDAIRKLADAATPGPWGVGNNTFVASELKQLDNGSIQYRYAVAELDEFAREEGDYPNPVSAEADAEFIAAARTLVPALCDEIEQLRAEREHMELQPTGTVEWLKNRVKEQATELDGLRAQVAAVETLLKITDGDPLGDHGIAIALGEIRRVLGEARERDA